jgi:hypothetical protein
MSPNAADYWPRDAEHTVLYRVIDEHLETFLETAQRHADGCRLPAFVEQEFRDFLTCGVLAHGFARLRCAECAFERLVPFSCKGRGFLLALHTPARRLRGPRHLLLLTPRFPRCIKGGRRGGSGNPWAVVRSASGDLARRPRRDVTSRGPLSRLCSFTAR